jgi:hypothetical protein
MILAKQGYIPSKFTLGLFTHKTRSIAFSLVVDDFGVKYEKKEDMDHLVKTLGDRYPIKDGWLVPARTCFFFNARVSFLFCRGGALAQNS